MMVALSVTEVQATKAQPRQPFIEGGEHPNIQWDRGPKMKLSLIVMTDGPAKGKAIPVNLSQFIIGRDPQCQLRPASAIISKRHCALLAKGGTFFVRDFDSTNGTFVNEERVTGERELKPDDILAVGPLKFTVKIDAPAPPVNKPTPLPKPLSKDTSEDDSVAAMLLDIADEGGGSPPHKGPDGVPDGSTIMDMASPITDDTNQNGEKPAAGKQPEKKKEGSGNTSAAAQAILQKYMRRQRT
jgi:predicted component of type VI protein secretion system